ncbi:hypothetical protein AAL_06736 [Moelleriella libera RCEF 2490]|uniref:DUF7918 domain-containing protein n=1 Tax=Moelleriella libera RCEF 2490 TaxID=1081109 RepID=A0A166NPQ3_9HYPO|nr:hypothetical protein AAL_06736 [Moelleriella libera RCEF 2490]
MAVIDEVPGVTVQIFVHDQTAHEYKPRPDELIPADVPQQLRYIESTAGATYFVRVAVDPNRKLVGREALIARVFIDGEEMGATFLDSQDSTWDFHGPEVPNSDGSSWSQALLSFKAVNIVRVVAEKCVAELEHDVCAFKDIGAIEVGVSTCRTGEPIALELETTRRNEKFDIAEKALKGRSVTHGTALEGAEPIEAPEFLSYSCEVLIARYRFHYRSQGILVPVLANEIVDADNPEEGLRKEMIIQRSPSPEATSIAEVLECATPEQLVTMAGNWLRMQREEKAVKQVEFLLLQQSSRLSS